jgi:pantoate kinase
MQVNAPLGDLSPAFDVSAMEALGPRDGHGFGMAGGSSLATVFGIARHSSLATGRWEGLVRR